MKKINFIVLAMLLMGLAFVVNMDTASAASSIYVNVTSGNDAWNGQSQFYTNGTNGPKKTISSGVTAVDANGTVNLADGIYSGNGNNGITISKNMTIKGQSKDGTIINGSNSNQIFTISSGVNVSLLNITIANAKSSNSGGSAIKNNGGTLTINNCTFKNNNASRTSWSNDIYGGAIYSTGPLTIINSTFINNSAYGQDYIAQGGAIYSTGPLTIIDSTFTNNSALGSGGSNLVVGGAISIQNSLNITRSTFINNMAGSTVGTEGFGGGALYIGTNTAPIANVSISESNFINNSATYGGAIWMNAGSSTKFATITQCTFVGNDAKNGGAIRNWGYLNLTNSYFTNNTATADGAAIYNYQGALNANFNQIINDTGNLEIYVNSGAVNATNNWWGSNTNVSSKVSNGVNVSTWLVLLLTRSPQTVLAGYTSTIIADLNHDQNGVYYDPADGHIPDGTPVIFTSTLGTINSAVMINGIATVTFTAGNTPGVATINATVNGYTNSTTVTIVPLATIILNQAVNTPVNVGDKVTFLVTATNNGPNTATNINIRDFIPAGLTGVTVTTSTGTYNSATGIWTITSLASGSSAVLNITGTASAAMAGKITNNTATEISQTQNTTQLPSSTKGVYTNLLNEAFVSPNGNDTTGDGTEAHPFKTIAMAIATVNSGGTIRIKNGIYNEHDLTISKNVNIVGESANSTIIDAQKLGRIFNIASGSTVSISNLTLVNGSVTGNGGAIYNAGNLTLSGSDLRNNTATATGGTLYNTGSSNIYFNRIIGTNNVIASPSGSVIANNNWWDSNSNPSSKLSGNVIASNWIVLTVTSSKNNVTVGGTSTITANLIYDNTGAYLDPSLGHVFDGIDITFKVTDSILGIVNPKVVLTVNGSASTIFTGVNNGVSTVSVSQDDETQNISIKVGTVNLWVTNYPWDSGVYTYNYKQQVVWLVQVNNLGNSTATGINVKFVVGKGFKVVSYNLIQPGTLTFDAVSNTFTWIIDRLEGGNNTPTGSYASFSVLLEPIKVGSGGDDFMFNSSIESCDQQNIGTTKSRVRNLVIIPSADVQVNQTVSNNNPKNGDYVTITVRVKNNGPSNATNVSIYDLIPSGLYVGSLDANTSIVVSMGNYNQTSGIWDILSLNNGTEAILTIVARVDAIAGTQITNRAYRSNTPSQYDWNTGNDATDFNLVVIV
jgi:uncharacterized repeat protein (TIGR01451 family)